MQTLRWSSALVGVQNPFKRSLASGYAKLSKQVKRPRQKIGGSNMKKRILLSVSGLLIVAMPLLAQDDGHSKKPFTATGTISQDRETFVCDKDHKTLKVTNPGSLRDMEGQHAKLTYRLAYAAGEIFVTSASTVQDQAVAHNAGDPAIPN
jgi:hypothetical protein